MTGQQLRNSILQEAIHGRLVPNTLQPGEKTARELLTDILAERQKAENAAKGKKAKKLTLSEIEEGPWELPEGWCWCRVQDLFDHSAGKAQNSSQKTEGKVYPYLTTSNVYWEGIDFTKVKEMAFTEEEYTKCSAIKGDLLVCEGGDVGRSCIWPYDYKIGLQNHIHRLRPVSDINVKFFYYVIMLYKSIGLIAGKGIGITGLSTGVLKGTIIPLPPLSIQHAIVEKIESLLPLVEEYDAAQGELKTLNEALPDKLRKSVLQEAIHGRLVPNTLQPGEKTARELLADILAERQKAENAAKGKKAKKLTLSEIEEEPWELPEGWCWCRMGDIGVFINGDRGKNYPSKDKLHTTGTIPFISAINMQNLTLRSDNILFLEEEQYERLGSGKLRKQDIVICIRGSLGKFCIYPLSIGAIASSLVIFRLIDLTLLKYVAAFINSVGFTNQIKEHDNGTAQPNLSAKDVSNFLLPLPPLSIQHSIVEKIEEIFKLLEK